MKSVKAFILQATKASYCEEIEVIQSLWSGYGKISRYLLTGGITKTVIVKNIIFPNQSNHPRGWNTTTSHERKVKSYEIETVFYTTYNLCNDNCRTPQLIGAKTIGEEQVIVLEDLDAAGYPIRKSQLNKNEVKICLKWLANFHALFLNVTPNGLWKKGTYWQLSTRLDELKVMDESVLKQKATIIDEKLNNCRFQTFVHGDAKVANFCFSEDMTKVAALDFQYVGGGCGIKDVAYLLGSCLTENECEQYESELLAYYFSELKESLNKNHKDMPVNELENEWRNLYPFAWTDFTRFLMGWMPTHQKINRYSKLQINKTLDLINNSSK